MQTVRVVVDVLLARRMQLRDGLAGFDKLILDPCHLGPERAALLAGEGDADLIPRSAIRRDGVHPHTRDLRSRISIWTRQLGPLA